MFVVLLNFLICRSFFSLFDGHKFTITLIVTMQQLNRSGQTLDTPIYILLTV